jgi:MFS family permease
MFIPSFLLLFKPAWLGMNPMRLLPVFFAGTLFYIGFTGLEPILPSLVSKTAGTASYGTSLGFYNTAQFVGSAVGGPLAGFLANYSAEPKLMVTLVGAAIGFLLMAATKPPARTETAAQ